ncbi:hypothetical protein AT302_17785 [Pandoraea norimbergensis]|uniref:Uncharacterized protein n=2 Tax=Pandoraea norimbergensis TaxID=93219 RepID=A0ABN4JK64_9BURK|nr:hypothetical protein AT302_17785 [Pandoraea norimbergensis]
MVSPDAGRAVAGTSDVADQAGQALPEVSTIAVTRAAEAKLEETLSQTAQVVKEAAQATTSAVIRNAQTIKEAAKQQTLLTAQSGGYAAFALANETARKKAAKQVEADAEAKAERVITARSDAATEVIAERLLHSRGMTLPQLQERKDKLSSKTTTEEVEARHKKLSEPSTSGQSRKKAGESSRIASAQFQAPDGSIRTTNKEQ